MGRLASCGQISNVQNEFSLPKNYSTKTEQNQDQPHLCRPEVFCPHISLTDAQKDEVRVKLAEMRRDSG
jgi:hypothetical protein